MRYSRCHMSAQKTIGIVGGGQLGRMLTQAAIPLGFKVVVVDAGENCPAKQVGAEPIVAPLYDPDALKELGERADFITVEIEHFDTTALAEVEASGVPVNPRPSTVRLIQDKYEQKVFLDKHNIPLARFARVDNERQARKVLKEFGGDIFLKARTGAYDGRGNAHVNSEESLADAMKNFGDTPLYAEQRIPFKRELAVMVARNNYGDVVAYPLTETIHERSICLETITPAPVYDEIAHAAVDIAKSAVSKLEGAGVFGVEMFQDQGDTIMINEIAPRVHNSGHYTMDACVTGQFEQHIRAITGLPLGDPSLLKPAASMINILGERNGDVDLTGVSEALKQDGTYVHVYGKAPTKVDRKMGHINVIGDTVEETQSAARKARQRIDI